MASPLADRIAKNLKAPWAIPEKLLFRLRLTPQHAWWARRRWDRASDRELADLLSRLEAIARQPARSDRFAPIFAGWPEGVPVIDERRTLDAHWYANGVGHRGALPEHLPAELEHLVLNPELGSSKSKLLPTFFELGRLARSAFEAGVYTGVTSMALIAAEIFIGSDILLRRRVKERLRPYLSATKALFEAPVKSMSLPRRSLDVIFLDMVHDVRNLVPTLDHVLDWLAPGGVLVIDDVGYRDSLYTADSLAAHVAALARSAPLAAVPPLVLERDGYRESLSHGHLAELAKYLPRCGRAFRHHHIADGGGTLFLWEQV